MPINNTVHGTENDKVKKSTVKEYFDKQNSKRSLLISSRDNKDS